MGIPQYAFFLIAQIRHCANGQAEQGCGVHRLPIVSIKSDSRLGSFLRTQEKTQEFTIIYVAYETEGKEQALACRVAAFDFREQRRPRVLGKEVLQRHIKKELAQPPAAKFRGDYDVRLPKLLTVSVKAHHANLFV